jgi:hypothetical protein
MKLVQWILDGDVLGCRQDVVRTIPFGPVVYWYKRDVKVVYQIYFRVVGTTVVKKMVMLRSGSQNNERVAS